MARRAKKDAIVREPVGLIEGDETYVNRKVFAGDEVPENWIFENDGDVDEDAEGVPGVGLGAAPHAYKNQLDETGAIKDEHKPEHQRGRGRKPGESKAETKSEGRPSESKSDK